MNSLGKSIKTFRENAGLNQDELAEKIGVKSGKQTISRWELGKAEPSLKELRKLAELFQISLAQLLKDDLPAGEPEEPKPGFITVPAQEFIDLQRQVIRLQGKDSQD